MWRDLVPISRFAALENLDGNKDINRAWNQVNAKILGRGV
jgi:hypothetical protein